MRKLAREHLLLRQRGDAGDRQPLGRHPRRCPVVCCFGFGLRAEPRELESVHHARHSRAYEKVE